MAKLKVDRVLSVYQPEPEGGKWGNRLGASIDNYQAGLYGVAEAVTGSDWARRQRERNEDDAAWQREQARRQGAIMSYKDVEGVGDALDYVGGLAVDSLPYLGEAAVGGVAGRALLSGAKTGLNLSRGTAGLAGGVAASYPSAVGDILQSQRDQSGETNLGSAAVGGIGYAGLNALGIEGMVARGQLARSGIRALDSLQGARGLAARTGASAVRGALTEGAIAEPGQEAINQSFGRMAVDPNETFLNERSIDRFQEAAVGGAALGGLFGGAMGGWRRSEGYEDRTLPPGQNVDTGTADLLGGQRISPDAQYGLQGDLFDGAGYDTSTNGSRDALAPAAPDLEALRSDLGELTAIADRAYREGNRSQLEAASAAIQQVQQQIMALTPADRTPSRMLGSGVNEMVNGMPVELTEDELANNLLPFVGDTNIDFPMGQGDGFQYEGGIDFSDAYTPVGEQPLVPQGTGLTRAGMAPTQTQIPTVDVLPGTAAVDSFGNVAGSESDLELMNDPGAQMARQQWLEKRRRDQELLAEAEKTRAEVERRRKRAAELGLKGDKNADTLAEMEQLLDEGIITAPQFSENLGLLQANKRGQVDRFLKGIAAQTDAVATATAAEQQTAIDNVRRKANGGSSVGGTAAAGAATQPATAGVQTQSTTSAPAAPAVPATGTGATGNGATGAATAGTRQQGAIAGIDPNKRVKVGRKGREKDLTPAELVARMAKATEIEKGRVAAATGLEAVQDPTTGATRLVVAGEPMTLDAIAERESQTTGKKVPRETIRLSLLKFGITPEVIDQLQGMSADSVSDAELGLDTDVDASGFRVETQLSKATGQGLVDDGNNETKAQRETREKADELLKAAGPTTAVATTNERPNAPEGATVTDLRQGNAAQAEANVRAILSSVEANNAAADWDSETVEWSELPDTLKADWVSAYTFNLKLNLGEIDFKELESDQKQIERDYADWRANAGQQEAARALPAGNTGAGNRAEVVEAAEAGQPRLRAPAARTEAGTVDADAREVSPAEEAWTALRANYPQMPAFSSLTERQQKQVTDLVRREQFNLAAANTISTQVNEDVLGGPPDVPLNNDVLGRDAPETRAVRGAATLGPKQQKTTSDGKYTGTLQAVTDVGAFEKAHRGFAEALAAVRALGLQNVIDSVDFYVADPAMFNDSERGMFTSVDGRVAILLSSDLMTTGQQNWLRHAAIHELGHAVDFWAASNGFTSNGTAWSVKASNGKVRPVGRLARAVMGMQRGNPAVADLLRYPLQYDAFTTPLSDAEISNELFAQTFFMFARGSVTLPSEVVSALQGAVNAAQNANTSTSLKNPVQANSSQPVRGDGSVRASVPTERDAPQSRAARAAAPNTQKSIIDALPYAMQDFLRAAGYNISNLAMKASFTDDLLARLAKVVPAAGTYFRETQKIVQSRNARELKLAEILKRHADLPKAERGTGPGSVNAVLMESTYSGEWAFQPDWVQNAKYDPNSKAAKAYDALSKEGKAAVRDVFRHGHKSLMDMKAAVKANIEAQYGNDKAAAAKAYADFNSIIAIHEGKPYAPLRRFGKHVVMATSKAYRQAIRDGDTARAQELQRSGDHYYVAFRDSKTEALALERELRNAFNGENEVISFERLPDQALGYGQRDIISGMNRLRQLIKDDTSVDAKFSADTKKRLEDMMQQLYLTMLSETSARKGEIHRKNIAGADSDMMMAFATQGRAQAQFIANLESDSKADLALGDVRKAISGMGGEREQAQALYNEILMRRSLDMEYKETPIVNGLLATASTYLLMTNPSYYAINATQPWMMSLPMMAARFGKGAATSELFKSYDGLTKVVKGGFTPESFKKLPPDVQQAVTALAERGRINISLALDLGKFESDKDGVRGAVDKTMGLMRSAAESVEAVNRIATAVAAYRLAKKGGMDAAKAIDYAESVIAETHGDYSAWNAPRFMRSGIGRLATQFRKFQLIQLSMFARFASRAMDKNLTADERKIAMTAIAYNIGLLGAMGGLAGLPGATLVMFLAGAMGLGDDETPDDWEASFRRAVGDKELADLMWYGGPKMLGLNLSGRVGAGDMLSLIPKTDVKLERDGYYEILAGFAGPMFGGVLPRAVDGISLMKQGDYWKGVEQMLPGGLSNIMKGYRFGEEGITKRNGDLVMSPDEISFLEGFMQAVGLPTNQITDRNSLVGAQFKADEFYKNRTTKLKRAYADAFDANDTEAMREAIEAWHKTQDARRRLGYKTQPISELRAAPRERAKREAGAVGGTTTTKGNEDFTRQMAELY